MKINKKIELLYALMYFSLFFIANISIVFSPLFENIYYGHLTNLFNSIVRALIYLILVIILSVTYKKINNEKREKKELPLKKKVVLYSITIFFITVISLMANWQLKPLNDLGEKYTIIQIYDKLGEIGVLAFDIYIMLSMFKHFDNFYISNFKDNKLYSFSIIFILFTYSIYSLITNLNIYQLIFIPFTLLLGFIYPYTEKSFWKTYLIAVLVFLF